jgi:hypothetical protein
MDEWVPALVLPNVDMRGAVECKFAAIAAPTDVRVERLRADHPNLTKFLSKFSNQFGNQVWPAILLLRAGASISYYTAEAVTAFRDILSLSVIPYARAYRLQFDRPNDRIFTDMFKFYPWMIDNMFEHVVLINTAQRHFQDLNVFCGQSYAEQPQSSLMEYEIDAPLAKCLLDRWVIRFAGEEVSQADKALFRSLNMANDAGRLPSPTATTFYDVGRSLALWVSAYEILAHPGGKGISNSKTVARILESVTWLDKELAKPAHLIPGSKPYLGQLATKVCNKIYRFRNDFLHGNDVDQSSLLINGHPVTDFAGCLYRLALTGFLELYYDDSKLHHDDEPGPQPVFGERFNFQKYQALFENALLKAI